MIFPTNQQKKRYSMLIIDFLEKHQGGSDAGAGFAAGIPDDHGGWAIERHLSLLKEYADIEDIAARDLNLIYLKEIAGKNATDRHTPAIMAQLKACAYPDVTKAMLHQDEYEPMIWGIIRKSI